MQPGEAFGPFVMHAHGEDRWHERSELPIGYLRLCLEHGMYSYIGYNHSRDLWLVYHAESKHYYVLVTEDEHVVTLLTSKMFRERHKELRMSTAKFELKKKLAELRAEWRSISIWCNGVQVHESAPDIRKDPIWDRFQLECDFAKYLSVNTSDPENLAAHISNGAPVAESMEYELRIGDDVIASDNIKLRKSYVANFNDMLRNYHFSVMPPVNREARRFHEKYRSKIKIQNPLEPSYIAKQIVRSRR